MRLLLRSIRLYSSAAGSAAKTVKDAQPATSAIKNIVSFAPAGTKLKGLNVRKNGEDPIALPEDEYPAWLWEVLDEKAQAAKLENDPDAKAARERRQANRQLIKNNNFLKSMSK